MAMKLSVLIRDLVIALAENGDCHVEVSVAESDREIDITGTDYPLRRADVCLCENGRAFVSLKASGQWRRSDEKQLYRFPDGSNPVRQLIPPGGG